MKRRRPAVIVQCVADRYANKSNERIVEFAFPNGKGGLIALRQINPDTCTVDVYRVDEGVTVHVGKVSENDGSGYMLDPTRCGVVRETIRGRKAYLIVFAVDGGEEKRWVRWATDRYTASDEAAEAIKREWPGATFFEISSVSETPHHLPHRVSERPAAAYRATRFVVEIDLTNDAFANHPELEVASLLFGIAEAVEHGSSGGPIYDTNGNTCGFYRHDKGEA